jgi:hypothetical protein
MTRTATRINVAIPGSPFASSVLFAIRCSLFAICILGAAPVRAQTPQELQTITDQVIRRLDLQTELPNGPEKLKFVIKLPPELLWVVVAIALGVLLYAFRDMIPILRSRQHGAWGGDEGKTGEMETGTPEAVLGAADELAAQGRFVEAMHVLLLQGLADIRQRLDEQFADSLTSREILRSTKLSEGGRVPLRDIIDRVELTYFGQRPAALADYQACRASFAALAGALHGAAQGSAA